MKQKKINDILYVFQVTPYEITEDTDASVIKVQLESYDGFIELNESLASKFVKYNYEMFTVHQQEWAPYVDAKEDADLEWSSDSATAIVGETNTYPTLTNTDNVEVTYDSSDTSVATIASDGTITLLEAGTTTISAIFAGDDTYNAKTVSYSLIVKEVPDLAWSSDSATAVVGETNTLPTLTNTDNVDVTYSSSDTSVASIASDGTVTILAAGTTTISAAFAGNTTYVAKTVSYSLTVSQHDYSTDYFTTKALGSGDISFTSKQDTRPSYRKNNGEWTNYTEAISVVQDDVVEWKQSKTLSSYQSAGMFSSTGDIDAYGNVMSLLYGDNFVNQIDFSGNNKNSSPFQNLFMNNNHLINAENLILPVTTLIDSCYNSMFSGCKSLITPPVLPATTLGSECYKSMFQDCTSLTTAPSLPATTLSWKCYNAMFSGCKSLITPPVLPATTLVLECYNGMFWGCTSLTTAPSLPATTLEGSCYANMFRGCTSLNNVTCLATDISASGCVNSWLTDTAASGTFYKDPNMTDWVVGTNVPSGWTIEDAYDDPGVDEGL